MPRTRLSADRGIEIAKPGFDVDTASIRDMMFSSRFVAMRIAKTGVVTCASYSGPMSDRMDRGIVYFDAPFAQPPIVLAAGIISQWESDQTSYAINALPVSSNDGALYPHYSIETYTDRFELYIHARMNNGQPYPYATHAWRYYVFANTLT